MFCAILASGVPDEEAHIVWRHPSGRALAILNAYPYTSGHLMVMPTRHVADLEDLGPEEAADVWERCDASCAGAKGARTSRTASTLGPTWAWPPGPGCPAISTCTCVPRWAGDTNFMTTVADARVLPEPLNESAAKLRLTWAQLENP